MNNHSQPVNKVTPEILSRLENKVVSIKPQLRHIKENYGDQYYFDYVRQKNRVNLHKPFSERKQEVITVIRDETARLLGTSIASDVEKQMKKNDSFSTAEHTAPLATNNVLNAALHHSLPKFGNPDPRFRNIIVLACSGISFGNELYFSRGLQFHVFPEKKVVDVNLTLFGRSVDAEAVMYAPPYPFEAVGEMKKKLDAIAREHGLDEEKRQAVEKILNIFGSPHALSGSDYVDQMTITNYYFWKELFPAFKEIQIPNYIMLSQEKILLQLLLKYHLNQDTPIHRFIFSTSHLDLIEKYFAGVTGAFSQDKTLGTFLFWGYSKQNRMRFQLFREGNYLVNKDKTYSLALTPDVVEKAIINKEIFPGLLLTFVTLSFYYGLLLGGFASQTTYLADMKKRYLEMMQELVDEQSVHDTEASITDDFIYTRPHLSFIQSGSERVSATPLDMYLYQDPAVWKEVIQATKTITFGEFISILYPTLYKQHCPPEEREDDLMHIFRQDVEEFVGLDKKVPPIGVIS